MRLLGLALTPTPALAPTLTLALALIPTPTLTLALTLTPTLTPTPTLTKASCAYWAYAAAHKGGIMLVSHRGEVVRRPACISHVHVDAHAHAQVTQQ